MSATFIEVHAALADAVRRGAHWASLSPSEELAMNAVLRRIAAMVVDGVKAEDWQQLAGYAEWANQRPPEMSTLANATIHGQWTPYDGGTQPIGNCLRIAIRSRGGFESPPGRADAFVWGWGHGAHDIIAYRIVD